MDILVRAILIHNFWTRFWIKFRTLWSSESEHYEQDIERFESFKFIELSLFNFIDLLSICNQRLNQARQIWPL